MSSSSSAAPISLPLSRRKLTVRHDVPSFHETGWSAFVDSAVRVNDKSPDKYRLQAIRHTHRQPTGQPTQTRCTPMFPARACPSLPGSTRSSSSPDAPHHSPVAAACRAVESVRTWHHPPRPPQPSTPIAPD
jgi:hypothetical protein